MKSVKSRVSGYFLENTQKEWSQIRHADVFWSHSIPVRFWSWYVDFPNFGHNCDKAIGLNWDIPYVYRRTRERNDMKFGMLMYIDNLQNSSDFCCCLLIFLILVQFWLSERGFQLGFPDIRKGSNLGFLDIKGWCINLKNSMKLSMLMYMQTAFIPDWVLSWYIHCPACRTTLVATRFRVAVICPIIQVPHCIRVFFYFVWFVFINHIFQFYYELCTYCNILDIYLS